MQNPIDTGLPWEQLASGGAAILVICVVWMFLRYLADQRKEHNAAMSAISKDFATTVENSNRAFSEAMERSAKHYTEGTQMILQDSRQRDIAMHQLLRDLDKDRT